MHSNRDGARLGNARKAWLQSRRPPFPGSGTRAAIRQIIFEAFTEGWYQAKADIWRPGPPHLVVPGKPQAWSRPRVDTRGRRPRLHNADRLTEYETLVASLARVAGIRREHGPVRGTIEAKWPSRGKDRKTDPWLPKWRTARPDVDNVAKAVLDGLTGIAFDDDAMVCELLVRKFYAAQGEEPSVSVWLDPIVHRP